MSIFILDNASFSSPHDFARTLLSVRNVEEWEMSKILRASWALMDDIEKKVPGYTTSKKVITSAVNENGCDVVIGFGYVLNGCVGVETLRFHIDPKTDNITVHKRDSCEQLVDET